MRGLMGTMRDHGWGSLGRREARKGGVGVAVHGSGRFPRDGHRPVGVLE